MTRHSLVTAMRAAQILALLAVAAMCSLISWRVYKLPDLTHTVANIDAATGAWSKASAAQAASVSAIERDIRAELWHVDRTLVTVDGTLTTAQGTLGAATGAVNTANAQLTHVGPVLDETQATIAQLQNPIAQANERLAQLKQPIDDLHATLLPSQVLISDPAIKGTLDHVDAVTGDIAKVSDKMTADYLKPVPWYMWPVKRIGEIWDISAAVARHTP